MTSAAIYTRIPRPGAGDSHQTQACRCQALADAMDLDVVEVFADTGMSRGEFLRMLDQVRSGRIEVVLVDVPGRLPSNIDALTRVTMAGGRLVSQKFDSDVPPCQEYARQVEQLLGRIDQLL